MTWSHFCFFILKLSINLREHRRLDFASLRGLRVKLAGFQRLCQISLCMNTSSVKYQQHKYMAKIIDKFSLCLIASKMFHKTNSRNVCAACPHSTHAAPAPAPARAADCCLGGLYRTKERRLWLLVSSQNHPPHNAGPGHVMSGDGPSASATPLEACQAPARGAGPRGALQKTPVPATTLREAKPASRRDPRREEPRPG